MSLRIKLRVDVTAAVRAGYAVPDEAIITITDEDLKNMGEESRDVLAKHLNPRMPYADEQRCDRVFSLMVVEPTLNGMLAAIEKEAEKVRERKAETEAEAARIASVSGNELVEFVTKCWTPGKGNMLYELKHHFQIDPTRHPYWPNIKAWCEEQQARVDKERKAAAQKADEKREAQRLKQQKVMEGWILEHGSKRLKLCLEAGVNFRELYTEERLAAERPGWVIESIDSKREFFAADSEYPANPPSLEVMEWYAQIKKSHPSAKLYYWVDKRRALLVDKPTILDEGWMCSDSHLGEEIELYFSQQENANV